MSTRTSHLTRRLQAVAFIGVILLAMGTVIGWVIPEGRPAARDPQPIAHGAWRASRDALDAHLAQAWEQHQLQPAPRVDDRLVARRLALALVGSIPSLEEWHLWESWPAATRTERWIDHLLADRRAADYLAERLARAYVGADDGTFLLFRRRRFVTWLSDQLMAHRPYDHLVRELLTDDGLWTSHPAVNFVTATAGTGEEEGQPNPIPLATRTSRAFLGVRLDCMQCHDDHLGGPWKQSDFHELAAFFAGTRNTITGIRDIDREYEFTYLKASQSTVVPCRVPFLRHLAEAHGELSKREQLAQWVTHPRNDPFPRAIVNRLWGIMLGRPLVDPVDDIPLEGPWPIPLQFLAEDFRNQHYDLHHLIRVIGNSRAFALDSRADQPLTLQHEALWACFPLLRLRPEQIAGAITQSASLQTLDAESHILIRLATADQRNSFMRRFGDGRDQELVPLSETIPQNLLLMNGELVSEKTKVDLLGNAATRIAQLAHNDQRAIQILFLTMLSRLPTVDETTVYLTRLAAARGEQRSQVLVDLAWVLTNCSEFGWSH